MPRSTAGEVEKAPDGFKVFPNPAPIPLFVPILGGVMLPSVMLMEMI